MFISIGSADCELGGKYTLYQTAVIPVDVTGQNTKPLNHRNC